MRHCHAALLAIVLALVGSRPAGAGTPAESLARPPEPQSASVAGQGPAARLAAREEASFLLRPERTRLPSGDVVAPSLAQRLFELAARQASHASLAADAWQALLAIHAELIADDVRVLLEAQRLATWSLALALREGRR